jgi:hypothetical protein
MTSINSPLLTSKNTNLAMDKDFDWGQLLQGIGLFLSGFGSSYGANSLTEADKVVRLISGMSDESKSELKHVYEQQKEVIALLRESEEFNRNNPSHRAQSNQAIKSIRNYISSNYHEMADIIYRELPSMRVNHSKVAPLAESVIRGLREAAAQALDTRYPIRDIRPQDSQSSANSSNRHIANSLQSSHNESYVNNLKNEAVDPVMKNAARIKSLFNLDVINNPRDKDVANYLMASSNSTDPDKIFETSSIFQSLSGKPAEDYKNAIAGKAFTIMDSGSESTSDIPGKAATYQL